jgi:hypothetical protein
VAVTGVDCQSPPLLVSRTPDDFDLEFRMDQTQVFSAVFETIGDAPLNRYWFFEGEQVGTGLNFNYTAEEKDVDEIRTLELMVTDGLCFSTTYWTIRSAPNEPPIVILQPATTEFTVEHNDDEIAPGASGDPPLTFSVDAEDPEGLPLTFTWTSSLYPDPVTSLFYKPEISDLNAGTDLVVVLEIDDSREKFYYSWLVHIQPNRLPVITPMANLQGEEGETLGGTASFADADRLDPITVSISSVGDCAMEAYIDTDFEAGQVTFIWATNFNTVSGTASDDSLICPVTITVSDDDPSSPEFNTTEFTVTINNGESFRNILPQATTDYVLYNSMLVDGNMPYVAYSTKDPKPHWPDWDEPCEVRVVHFDGSNWVDDSGDLSASENNTALSRPELFKHNGQLHVAYTSGTTDTAEGADAHVKAFDGSVWTEVGGGPVDAGESVYVDRVKVVSDGSNIYLAYYQTPTTPAVSYYESHYSLYVSKYDGVSWQTLGSEVNAGSEDLTVNVSHRMFDIAVDPSGVVYVGYVHQDYIHSSGLSVGQGYVAYYDTGSGQWVKVLADPLNHGTLSPGLVSTYISGLDLEFIGDKLYVAAVDSDLDWYYNVIATGALRVYTPEAGAWNIVGEKLNEPYLTVRASHPRLMQKNGVLYVTFGQDMFYDNNMVEPIGYGMLRQLVDNAWEPVGFVLNNSAPINIFAGIGFGISSSGEYYVSMAETGILSNVGSRLYLYDYRY